MRRKRGVRVGIVFIGVAQEKAQAFSGKKIGGQFEFTRDKTVYVNHYYFYIDDADFGPLILKVCSYAPWGIKLCLNGHEWASSLRSVALGEPNFCPSVAFFHAR